MLTLAKNKQHHDKVRVLLANEIDEVIHVFNGVADRSITFEQGEAGLHVDADPGQLKQLIYILLDNALKYSQAGVHVRLYQETAQAVVEVQDYGPGIAPQDQERIFDRFYRVDKARSRDTGGTGLGLAIAKSIVDAHNGELTVRSKRNEGSTFTVRLPLAEATA